MKFMKVHTFINLVITTDISNIALDKISETGEIVPFFLCFFISEVHGTLDKTRNLCSKSVESKACRKAFHK